MPTRLNRRKVKHSLTVLAFLAPWLIGFIALFVYSIAQTFWYSFTNYNLLNDPSPVGGANYVSLWNDAAFWETLANTGFFVVLLVPGILFIAFLFAVMVNTKSVLSKFATMAYFVPFVIPLAATGLVWRWIFNGEFGVLNYLLSVIGVNGPSWLVDRTWVKPAIVIAQITLIGQFFIIFVAKLQDIPKSLYESADLDGASALRKTISITVPMASPAILFNLVTCFIIVFQIFEIPYIMTFGGGGGAQSFGGPGRSSTTLAMYMYQKMFVEYDASLASAIAVISFVIVLAVSVAMMKASDRFVYYES